MQSMIFIPLDLPVKICHFLTFVLKSSDISLEYVILRATGR